MIGVTPNYLGSPLSNAEKVCKSSRFQLLNFRFTVTQLIYKLVLAQIEYTREINTSIKNVELVIALQLQQ